MASKSSVMEMSVKLVLVFFICLLAFSVGTFVGKEFSDSEYRRASLEGELSPNRATASYEDEEKSEGVSKEELASLTDEFIQQEKGKMEIEATGDHPAASDQNIHDDEADNETSVQASTGRGYKKFGDKNSEPNAKAVPSKEVAKKIEAEKAEVAEYKKVIAAKAAQNAQATATPTKAAQSAQASAAPAKATAPAKTSAGWDAADKVAQNQPATAGKPEVRTPSSVLPSVAASAVGKYTVQIASYATETEAKNHASKLKEKGWQAFYISADISGKTWYRVSVGLFNNSASAKNFQEELAKEANITSSIVQKIVK